MTLLELLARIKSPTLRAVAVFTVALYNIATGRTYPRLIEDEKALMRWEDDGGR